MSVLNGLDSAAAMLVAEAIINSIWQGALLAALIWLLLRFSGWSNATTRYSIWLGTLLAVACLPFLNAFASHRSRTAQSILLPAYGSTAALSSSTEMAPREPLEGAAHAEALEQEDGAQKEAEAVANARAEALMGSDAEESAPDSSLPASVVQRSQLIRLSGERWPGLFLSLWMLGVLAMTVRLLRGYLSLRGLKRGARPLAEIYQRRLAHWLKSCGIRRRVRLHGSKETSVPLMLGLRETIILFPWRLTSELAEDEFDQVLLHELAHARRRDDWTNLLQKLCEALLFFHPAVWLIGRQLNAERELACDQWVVALTGAHRSYASCLAKLFELTSRPTQSLLAPGALKARSHLTRRIETILKSKRSATARLSLVRLLVPLLLLGALLMEFGRVPPVIALSAPSDDAAEMTAHGAEQADAFVGWTGARHESNRTGIEARARQQQQEQELSALETQRPVPPTAEMAQGLARVELVRANERIAPGFASPPEGMTMQPALETVESGRATNEPQQQQGSGGDGQNQAAAEVLRTIAAIDSAASQRELLLAFLKQERLSREFLVQAFVIAKRMDSDGEKAEFLIKAAGYCTSDAAVLNAYFSAVASIDSDGEKRRALEGVLRARGHERPVLIRTLRTASNIHSDGETAELLVKAASAYSIEGEALSAFLNAVSAIDSAGERRRALTAALRRGGVSRETLVQVVRFARSISSDGEKAEFLVRFASACQGSEAALNAYMATAASIHSSEEQRRALDAIMKKTAT